MITKSIKELPTEILVVKPSRWFIVKYLHLILLIILSYLQSANVHNFEMYAPTLIVSRIKSIIFSDRTRDKNPL